MSEVSELQFSTLVFWEELILQSQLVRARVTLLHTD